VFGKGCAAFSYCGGLNLKLWGAGAELTGVAGGRMEWADVRFWAYFFFFFFLVIYVIGLGLMLHRLEPFIYYSFPQAVSVSTLLISTVLFS
jgi:hypothetical protein